MAARPIMAPAMPVSARRRITSAPLVKSPLPTTGIETADTTSPITFQSASPE
jgi:hypothetical protein